jgi:hypothetical protein
LDDRVKYKEMVMPKNAHQEAASHHETQLRLIGLRPSITGREITRRGKSDQPEFLYHGE